LPSPAEQERAFILVVRAAPQFQVSDRRFAAERERVDVVKLESARFTTSALFADERTAASVARPDVTANGRRNVSCCGFRRSIV
jgi:hypothetical protein